MRSMASWRSAALKSQVPEPVVEEGKSGRMKTAIRPMRKLAAPSIMKSHCQPARPLRNGVSSGFSRAVGWFLHRSIQSGEDACCQQA